MKSTEDKKDFHEGLMDDEAQMEMRQLITEALLIGKGRNDNAEKEWDRFALKSGIRKQRFDMKYLLRIAACIAVLLICGVCSKGGIRQDSHNLRQYLYRG